MLVAQTASPRAGAVARTQARQALTAAVVSALQAGLDAPAILSSVQAALDETAALLDRARTAGIPVIHIQHDSGPGSPYDIRADIGAIVDQVAPRGDEPVIVKQFPNSFVQTDLDERLKALGASNLVLAGFMTHMCVNSTARGAFSLGYAPTVVAAATATRTLAGPDGQAVPAAALQAASLAGLADLVAVVAPNAAAIPD